jgi:hypothetical protein
VAAAGPELYRGLDTLQWGILGKKKSRRGK